MTKNEIHNVICDLVATIKAERRTALKHPDHAMVIRDGLVSKLAPLCDRLTFYITLGEMVELGLIETGRTINDTYVRLLKQ